MKPTIANLLAGHALYRPDKTALVVGGEAYSFFEFHSAVGRLVSAFFRCGLVKGDKVATVLGNGFELMAVYWAAAASGVVVVPCSALLRTGGLKTLLNDSDAVLVIADAVQVDALDEIRGELSGVAGDRFVLTGCDTAPTGYQTYSAFISIGSIKRI